MLYVFFLFVIVLWSMPRLPIITGGNCTLFSKTTRIRVAETKVTWMKNSDVIVHHGLVFYPSKYTAFSSVDGSSVTRPELKTSTYLTHVFQMFFSYESVLQLNDTNYIGNTNLTCLPNYYFLLNWKSFRLFNRKIVLNTHEIFATGRFNQLYIERKVGV